MPDVLVIFVCKFAKSYLFVTRLTDLVVISIL